MAYTKILHIKSNTHLNDVINYITAPDKTDINLYVASYNCDISCVAKCFDEVMKNAKSKKGNNIAHHIIQSFSPEDNITPEQAMFIGQELMRRLYPDYQYVIATHTNCGHIHNHIVMNAVNFETFYKLNTNKKNYEFIRNTSDDLCRENGLEVIPNDTISQKKRLKADIDKCIEKSTNFDEFIALMKSKGYSIKTGKYLSFKGLCDERYMRTTTIGSAYTENSIRQRMNRVSVSNRSRNIFNDKSVRMSNRKRLILTIEYALKATESYEDFLRLLQEENVEVKQGKHLAMRLPSSEKFIRVGNIGEEYSEDMLRLYFNDRAEYENTKNILRSMRVQRAIVKDSPYNKNVAAYNVNIHIRTLNMLSDNGISSLDELSKEIDSLKKQINLESQKIKELECEIKSKREIKTAVRTYWKLKPIFIEYTSLPADYEKEKFMSEHSQEINRYQYAVEIINRSKKIDGSLPKAAEINAEIQKYQIQKEDIEKNLNKMELQLSNYLNIQDNISHLDVRSKTDRATENTGTINL